MNVTHYPAALHIKCFRIHILELHKVIYRKYHCLIYILMNVAILSSSCNLTNATLRHEDITVLFSCLHTFVHTHYTLPLFFKNFTHKSKNCTQNAKCLTAQNITNASQKHTIAVILIPVGFVCCIENCVLRLAK